MSIPFLRRTLALAGLVAAASCSEGEGVGTPEGNGGAPWRPNILLISIDTLRADHLGCYGYERDTSPFIDSRAENGVLFERCFSTAPNTAPSHMSLMTSLFPTAHAVPNAKPQGEDKLIVGLRLRQETLPLAELLRMNGYRTAAIADGGNVIEFFGFARGFDTFESKYEGVTAKVDQAIEWLAHRREPSEPFFLFLHTYEVHEPYLPPPDLLARFAGEYDGWIRDFCFDEDGHVRSADIHGFSEVFDQRERMTPEDVEFLKALYDAEIVHTDRELARLWRHIEESGLDEDLLVILLSDHGEEFGEHGDFGHKQTYDEVTHVPLILFGSLPPGVSPGRVSPQVSLIDVMPTLLEELGIRPPEYIQGRSLSRLLRGEGAGNPYVFAELIDFTDQPQTTMVRAEDAKMMRTRQGYRLYDLKADPGETEDLSAKRTKKLAEMTELHRKWLLRNRALRGQHGAEETGRRDLPPEELRQLGY